MEKVINYFKVRKAETQTVIRNASHLVQTVSLLVCAYYNYATAHAAHLSDFEFKIRVAASVVIGLSGAYLLLRYLANKEVK
jgi:hypothetical protein